MRGHIKKRGPNSYAVIIPLGRDPETGKYKQKWYSYPSRAEAEYHLPRLVTEVQGGGSAPMTKITLGEFLDRWLDEYCKGRLAATTYASYSEAIQVHIKPNLGRILLMKLTASHIQKYFGMKQAGEGEIKRSKKREKAPAVPLSSTTVRYHGMILNKALGYAFKKGYLMRNPCERVDPPKRNRPEMTVWTTEQIQAFLKKAKEISPYYRLYLAAVTTGMRQGELLGLRWSDVDLQKGTATVQQTLYRLSGKILFKPPKTAKSKRKLDLPQILIDELTAFFTEQVEHRFQLKEKYQDNGLIFCQRNGKPEHAHNIVRRDFKKVITAAEVPEIRFHDLRHCHATLLFAQGVHPKIVQERLGHSAIGITLDLYTHAVQGMQKEAVTAMEARLFGEEKPH
jgi:integrase